MERNGGRRDFGSTPSRTSELSRATATAGQTPGPDREKPSTTRGPSSVKATSQPIVLSGQNASAALIAKGIRQDAARMLTALTMGTQEQVSLAAFGQALLSYGLENEELEEYEMARRYYESALRLGRQLDQGAVVANERLAGLDMQLEGIESRLPNPPIELPASYPVVRDEMLRQIDQRFGR